MSNAVKVIYNMQDDTRIREAARQREKAPYDMRSSIALAERRGEAKGIAIGEARGISIGRNSILNEMISQGMITPEQAAQF